MGDCGIPGCSNNKFTPGGTKSFKCQYWKNQALKKNESISLILSKNNDRKIQQYSGRLDFSTILETLPFKNSYLDAPFNSSIETDPSDQQPIVHRPVLPEPTKDKDQEEEPLQIIHHHVREELYDEPLPFIRHHIVKSDDEQINQMNKPPEMAEFFLNLENFKAKDKTFDYTQPPDIDSCNISNMFVDSSALDLVKVKLKAITQQPKPVDDVFITLEDGLKKRINDKIKLYFDTYSPYFNGNRPANTTYVLYDDLKISYHEFIKYSKHLARKSKIYHTYTYATTYHSGIAWNKQRYLVTKNKKIIRYLTMMFPLIFRVFDETDYGDGETPVNIDLFDPGKLQEYNQIQIVPDFNFIKTENLQEDQLAYFEDENYSYGQKIKFTNSAFISNSYFIEVQILNHFNTPDVDFMFLQYDTAIKYYNFNMERLHKFIAKFSTSQEDFIKKYCFY